MGRATKLQDLYVARGKKHKSSGSTSKWTWKGPSGIWDPLNTIVAGQQYNLQGNFNRYLDTIIV
eukprot:6173350-Pleurochrysis_carterae.AAC.5